MTVQSRMRLALVVLCVCLSVSLSGQTNTFTPFSMTKGSVSLVNEDDVINVNTGDVGLSGATDQYITNSNLAINNRIKAGSILEWKLAATKTNAGTATGVCKVHFGTNGSTADTARLTFTLTSAQTAAVDAAQITIRVLVRSISATGVVSGSFGLTHSGSGNATVADAGFISRSADALSVVSGSFDNDEASLIAGVSCNPGASGVWTFQSVFAEARNLK